MHYVPTADIETFWQKRVAKLNKLLLWYGFSCAVFIASSIFCVWTSKIVHGTPEMNNLIYLHVGMVLSMFFVIASVLALTYTLGAFQERYDNPVQGRDSIVLASWMQYCPAIEKFIDDVRMHRDILRIDYLMAQAWWETQVNKEPTPFAEAEKKSLDYINGQR